MVRRGDSITARTWADMGLRLRPDFADHFAQWVAPLEGAAAGGGSNGNASAGAEQASSQTVFQILPQGAPGLVEYTVEIDGQATRYRNTAPAWVNFVWPNPSGNPGVRITGITVDGRSVELLNEPGRFGLTRMFELAQRRKLNDNVNELSWSRNGQTVTVQLRLISQPGASAPPPNQADGGGNAPAGGTSSLRNLRLPTLVVGNDQPVGTPTAVPSQVASAEAAQ